MIGSQRVRLADLQRPARPPRIWLRRHPVLIDVAVVLAACGPSALALSLRGGMPGWWGYPLLALTAAALLLRRRWPFAVLVVVAVSCAASPLAQPGFGYPMIPFAVALYGVASTQATPRAIGGYVVGVASTALATIPYALSGTPPPLATVLEPFSLIALAVGLLVRGRRERRLALDELVNERIEHAASSERARIAAEMHDVVAHSIAVMIALAGGAEAGWSAHPERARTALGKIGVVGREALTDVHRVLRILRDADAGLDGGLRDAGASSLDALAATYRDAGLPVALSLEGLPLPEDVALRIAVHRIVRESLANTLRHAAGATGATVTVTTTEREIVIEVTDDGTPARVRTGIGHGLTGIRERAQRHGGDSVAGPAPGGGWRTRTTLRTGAADA